MHNRAGAAPGDTMGAGLSSGRNGLKAGLWLLTFVLLLLGSLGLFAMAELAQWLAAELPRWVGSLPALPQWPQPVWLSLWLDPALIQAAQAFLLWLLDVLRLLGVSVQGIGTFLVVIVGLVWALGAFVLLALAVAAHLLWSRRQRRRSAAA